MNKGCGMIKLLNSWQAGNEARQQPQLGKGEGLHMDLRVITAELTETHH